MVEGHRLSGQQPYRPGRQRGGRNEAVETSGVGQQPVWEPKFLSKEKGAIVSWTVSASESISVRSWPR
jgi:hypothetical protein